MRTLLLSILCLAGVLAIAAPARAETIRIEPGVNADAGAQAAFARAKPGDRIHFAKGRFDLTRPLVLRASGVEISGQGANQTTLSFAGAPAGADAVRVNGDKIAVRNLAIEDAKGAALGASGSNLLIEAVAVRRAAGPGIVIVAAHNAIVRNSAVQAAQAGFGAQNASRVALVNNTAGGNGVGVVVMNRPGEAPAGAGVRIARNRILANAGEGVGIDIVAGRDVAVLDNEIGEHGTANILVRAFDGDIAIAGYSATPGNITIAGNKFGRAGFAPSARFAPALANGARFGDIVWDGARSYVAAGVPRTEPVLFAIADNRADNGAPSFLSLGLEAAGAPAAEALPSPQWPPVAKFKPPAEVKLD